LIEQLESKDPDIIEVQRGLLSHAVLS
jgi:hypothetical protein